VLRLLPQLLQLVHVGVCLSAKQVSRPPSPAGRRLALRPGAGARHPAHWALDPGRSI
jgi:hypothetical protein